jgi:hypothetical protein
MIIARAPPITAKDTSFVCILLDLAVVFHGRKQGKEKETEVVLLRRQELQEGFIVLILSCTGSHESEAQPYGMMHSSTRTNST